MRDLGTLMTVLSSPLLVMILHQLGKAVRALVDLADEWREMRKDVKEHGERLDKIESLPIIKTALLSEQGMVSRS